MLGADISIALNLDDCNKRQMLMLCPIQAWISLSFFNEESGDVEKMARKWGTRHMYWYLEDFTSQVSLNTRPCKKGEERL